MLERRPQPAVRLGDHLQRGHARVVLGLGHHVGGQAPLARDRERHRVGGDRERQGHHRDERDDDHDGTDQGRSAPQRVERRDGREHESEPREAQPGARPHGHDVGPDDRHRHERGHDRRGEAEQDRAEREDGAAPSGREHRGERGEHERHDEHRGDESRIERRVRPDELVPAAPAAARAGRARAATPRAPDRRAGTPGSASRPKGVPRPTCSTMRGSASTRAGIGSPASRTAARPLTASATIQPTTSAGARLGAAAMTAANSSDAVAAAAQDVAAPNTANTSQPSRTCAMTAPGRPSASAVRNGGAATHSEGRDRPQRTALGEPGGGEPGPDRRGGHGGEPEQHHRERRRPERERAEHREHAGERVGGADEARADVAPAVRGVAPELGEARQRQQSAAADATRADEPGEQPDGCRGGPEQHPRAARADELQLVRSPARSRPSRFRGGLAASARLVGLHPQRRDRRPADGARRLQDAPGAGDPHAGEHGGQRRGELARDGARAA